MGLFDEEPSSTVQEPLQELRPRVEATPSRPAPPSPSELEGADAGRRGPVVLADIVEQIRRDTEALSDPWLESEWWREFYRERIESFRSWAKEMR